MAVSFHAPATMAEFIMGETILRKTRLAIQRILREAGLTDLWTTVRITSPNGMMLDTLAPLWVNVDWETSYATIFMDPPQLPASERLRREQPLPGGFP
jgi:hypothetical protein